MTGNNVELIRKMLKMQAKLDKTIMDEYGLTEIDEEKLNMAILDEIGELNHELKAKMELRRKSRNKFLSTQLYQVRYKLIQIALWQFLLPT